VLLTNNNIADIQRDYLPRELWFSMELTKKHRPASWYRSVYNGLAQVIVQSDKTDDEIQLSARANGLREENVTIRTSAGQGHFTARQK